MSSTVVHVQNISPQTSDKEVRDFFSFCGKISSLSVTPASDAADSPKTATVTFEKESASKTALLLDNTQLGPSQVHVSAAANLEQLAGSGGIASEGASDEELRQDEKPRSRIVAEYLAHGYVLSDNVIQKAIAMDNKHGISNRFTNALSSFDSKYKASEKARGIDTQYGLSERASTGWNHLSSYFEKAMGTPTGQKLVTFYTKGDKEVRDIHTEARRLADFKSGKTSASATGATPAEASAAGIPLESSAGGTTGNVPTTLPGTDKTTCQCAGKDGACPCQAGKCACSGCGKSSGSAGLGGPPTATAETSASTGAPTGATGTAAGTSGAVPSVEK